MPGGRPRSFDRDAALAAALGVFWRRGFRDASLDDLTAACGVSRPSLYAAFGDKSALFAAALDLYREREVAPLLAILDVPGDGRGAVRAFLADAAARYTDPDRPAGCLVALHGAGAGGSDEAVSDLAAAAADATRAALKARLVMSRAAGELPAGEPVGPLADLFAAVLHGLSTAAKLGRSRRDLLAVVDTAVRAWPD